MSKCADVLTVITSSSPSLVSRVQPSSEPTLALSSSFADKGGPWCVSSGCVLSRRRNFFTVSSCVQWCRRSAAAGGAPSVEGHVERVRRGFPPVVPVGTALTGRVEGDRGQVEDREPFPTTLGSLRVIGSVARIGAPKSFWMVRVGLGRSRRFIERRNGSGRRLGSGCGSAVRLSGLVGQDGRSVRRCASSARCVWCAADVRWYGRVRCEQDQGPGTVPLSGSASIAHR